MDLLSQQPLFSTETETKGFDLSSGNRWIYPENYPIREYQFTIVKTALFHNTLVCLPTGLGKTFIAAVVMYNFWRWYPSGIIVFLAPTKPLVAQQIDACHDIMGIPISQTIELTGATVQKKREIAWQNTRVIFATPHTFQKDLEKKIVKTELIKCVVIDEAHRALGKHAYCESIRLLQQTNCYYRLLALSATPGSNLNAVQDVIRNLHITHLELRDDTSPDITPYVNQRKLEIIQVELGDNLKRFHERYIEIMDPHFRVLLQNKIIYGATANISKGRIFILRREFMNRQNKPRNYGSIVQTLNILMNMCHANDLFINHGLRAFLHFHRNHSDKYWLKEPNLLALLEEITEFIGPFPDIQALMNDDTMNIPENIVFGHEKFNKLHELLKTHFESAAKKKFDTRAIVFVEYKDIVNEVFVLLLQLRPLIRPQIFVGQAGLKQKLQKKALDDFRNNRVNVLISTCVGEEGLDVGEVDLIICFDISQNSPTRLVQRMGRTGRKRDGHIIILVTDCREHKILKTALAKRDTLNNKVLHSSGVIDALGKESPRMIPIDLNPECLKMRITAIPISPHSKNLRKKIQPKVNKKGNDTNEKKPTKKVKPTPINKTINSPKIMKNTMMKFLAGSSNQNCTSNNVNDFIDMMIEETDLTEFQSKSHSINSSVRIKPSDVRLLTTDNESIEFLTLCTLRQSEKEMKTDEKLLNVSYMIEFPFGNSDPFLNFEIPSVSILNCIQTLNEYSSPIEEVDEVAEVHKEDNIMEMWESHHVSHFMDNSRCPESILTNGRFEDLLDDSLSSSSKSDKTVFSGNELYLDQQGDLWEKNGKTNENIFQQKNNVIENDKKCLQNSIVIGGAFEDILDEFSDDDSVIEIPVMQQVPETISNNFSNNRNTINNTKIISQVMNELPIINLNTSKPVDVSQNNGDNLNKIISSSCHTPADKNIQENRDFGSNSNSTKFSTTNLIKSRENIRISSPFLLENTMGREKSQPIGYCTSRDLSKSSQYRMKTKRNTSLNATVEQPTITFESTEEKADRANSTDEDIFGVESLLFDSDIEDQITTIEKANNVENKMDVDINPSVEQDNVQKSIDDLTLQFHKNNNLSDINFAEDFDWNSDFEVSSTPITDSKYFSSNSDITSRNSFQIKPTNANITEKSLGSRIEATDNNKRNKLSQSNSNSDEKLVSIREKFLSKVRSKIQQNSNSVNDFAPKKIERTESRRINNSFSDDEIFGDDLSRSMTGNKSHLMSNGNRPKLSSVKNFHQNVASQKCVSKLKLCSRTKPSSSSSSIETKRLTSSDSFPRKKKQSSKRHARVKNAFIDDEAEVSDDETHSLGSSDNNDENDDSIEDFVSHTQYHDTTVDMRAHYLQSIRSPRQPGKFLIKRANNQLTDMEIYSQAIPDESNTYLHDSFCVDGEEISELSDHSSLDEFSILTQAERKLKRKKRKRENPSGLFDVKRRRIIINGSDDTSEDETEKLRGEIADQSLILKN